MCVCVCVQCIWLSGNEFKYVIKCLPGRARAQQCSCNAGGEGRKISTFMMKWRD